MTQNGKEQISKCNLIHFDNQQNQFQQEYTGKLLYKDQSTLYQLNSFRQVSDWTNRYKLHDQTVKTQSSNSPKTLRKRSFLNPIIPRSRNLSDESSKKKELLMSPINVRFCEQEKPCHRGQLKKRQFRKRQMSVSVYDSNSRQLSQLYQLKINEKSQRSKEREVDGPLTVCSYIRQSKLPKTEMISSIMRIMKKRQQILTFRKRNIQEYQASKNNRN